MLIKIIKLPFYLTLGYLGMLFCGGMSIIKMFEYFFQYTKETKPNKLDQFFY